mmetsp:Transcript_110072/g.306061  ORF Transcript_110072/g.306061 Transcript_110072/m.306061 type:complete len:269 (-) Transcript_110072:11-817(-)
MNPTTLLPTCWGNTLAANAAKSPKSLFNGSRYFMKAPRPPSKSRTQRSSSASACRAAPEEGFASAPRVGLSQTPPREEPGASRAAPSRRDLLWRSLGSAPRSPCRRSRRLSSPRRPVSPRRSRCSRRSASLRRSLSPSGLRRVPRPPRSGDSRRRLRDLLLWLRCLPSSPAVLLLRYLSFGSAREDLRPSLAPPDRRTREIASASGSRRPTSTSIASARSLASRTRFRTSGLPTNCRTFSPVISRKPNSTSSPRRNSRTNRSMTRKVS